jgi:hypothetical protein
MKLQQFNPGQTFVFGKHEALKLHGASQAIYTQREDQAIYPNTGVFYNAVITAPSPLRGCLLEVPEDDNTLSPKHHFSQEIHCEMLDHLAKINQEFTPLEFKITPFKFSHELTEALKKKFQEALMIPKLQILIIELKDAVNGISNSSVLGVVAHDSNTPPSTVAYYTLLIPPPGYDPKPARIQVDEGIYELSRPLRSLKEGPLGGFGQEALKTHLRELFPKAWVAEVGTAIVPTTFDFKNDQKLHELASGVGVACTTLWSMFQEDFKDISLTWDHPGLRMTLQWNPPLVMDLFDQPIRADVIMTLGIGGQQGSRVQDLGRLYGYFDLDPKTLAHRFIITRVESEMAYTPAMVLMLVSQGNIWRNPKVWDQVKNRPEVLKGTFNPEELQIALDIPELTLESWYLEIYGLIDYTGGARTEFLKTLATLTRDSFDVHKCYPYLQAAEPVQLGTVDSSIPGGPPRDLRTVDVWTVMQSTNKVGRQAFIESFTSIQDPVEIRLIKREALLHVFGRNPKVTGMANRVTFSNNFLNELTQAMAQHGFYIDTVVSS